MNASSRLAEFRNRSIGFVFQFHHLLPEFTRARERDDAGADPGHVAAEQGAASGAKDILGRVGLLPSAHPPAERALGWRAAARGPRARARPRAVAPARRRADRQPRPLDRRGRSIELFLDLNKRARFDAARGHAQSRSSQSLMPRRLQAWSMVAGSSKRMAMRIAPTREGTDARRHRARERTGIRSLRPPGSPSLMPSLIMEWCRESQCPPRGRRARRRRREPAVRGRKQPSPTTCTCTVQHRRSSGSRPPDRALPQRS